MIQWSVSRLWRGESRTMASQTAAACASRHQANSVGPGAGNRAAQRAVRTGRPAHFGEARDERRALRLDDHVLEGFAHHVQIVGVAAGDEAGEVGGLPDEVGQLDLLLQNAHVPRASRGTCGDGRSRRESPAAPGSA